MLCSRCVRDADKMRRRLMMGSRLEPLFPEYSLLLMALAVAASFLVSKV